MTLLHLLSTFIPPKKSMPDGVFFAFLGFIVIGSFLAICIYASLRFIYSMKIKHTADIQTRRVIKAVETPIKTNNPSRIFQLNYNVSKNQPYNLSGSKIEPLFLEPLEKRGLDVEDVIEIEANQESWLAVSTGTRMLLMYQPSQSHFVTSNIEAKDLASHNGRLYALSQGNVYSAKLSDLANKTYAQFLPVPELQNESILAIEGTHSRSVIVAIAESGTMYLQNDRIIKRQEAVRSIVFGDTINEYVTPARRGIILHPNDQNITDVNSVIITPDNHLYGVSIGANAWIKRMRMISGEPVFISERGEDVPYTIA